MHPHLTDEELISHFYGDDGPADREAVVDAHLQACDRCQAVFAEIMRSLNMADAVSVPEPEPDFEQRMWARIQPALPRDAPRRAVFGGLFGRRGGARLPVWLLPAAGLAAAAILVLVAGRTWRGATESGAPASAPRAVQVDPRARERVLLTALDDHFQRSERLLVEVMNSDAAPGQALGLERETAGDLVDSSRLYRQTAQQNGNVRLAQMLEELESVLVEIARSPEQVNRNDVHSLRTRIDGDDLLFKVRAVSKQIENRQKDLATE